MTTDTKVKIILDKHNKENNNCLTVLAYDEEKHKAIVAAMIEAFETGEDSFQERSIKAIENASAKNEKINADDSFQVAYAHSVEIIKGLTHE